ncbi:NTP transferase domain-containing protein [Patescibacteria group bacterium]|nr:NTP transferase domain-containing protein [Patescibacteria group bacterium]
MAPAEENKIKIIILAAGKGMRMQSDEPKALTLFKNKPFLLHILDTIKKLNPNIKPIIVIGHKKERIKEVLGEDYTYVEQHEQLGTGHAVASTKSVLVRPHEMVLILSSDQPLVSKETIECLFTTHLEKKPAITLGTVVVPDYEDWRINLYTNFGRIVREKNGKIKKLVEFKNTTDEEKRIREINPALYIFDGKWLWDNIDKIEIDPTRNEYKLTDLIHIAFSQKKKIEAVPVANILEALQPNSKKELEILEKLIL